MSIFRRDLPDPPPGRKTAGRPATPPNAATRSPSVAPQAPQRETLIAAGTKVKGEINGAADLSIEGHFEGRIRLDSTVTIGGDGRVQGEIQARVVRIGGQVRGDVTGTDLVELLSTARLEGNVTAARVVIAEGCFFKGHVVPRRIRRCGHVGRARVRLGMGVGVDHGVEFPTVIIGVELRSEMVSER